MQNVRSRARILGRRHARVHFNLNGRVRPSLSHETFPEDTTRDSILKQILARIKKSEGELSTCKIRTNELLNIPEDSLTVARLSQEQYLIDDLIDYVESLLGDETKLQIVIDKVNHRLYAKRLKRDLLNWIARNETELQEIDALENRVMRRYLQITHENRYLQRIFRDMKCFTNSISDSFKTVEISSELTSIDTSETQSSLQSYENEDDLKSDNS